MIRGKICVDTAVIVSNVSNLRLITDDSLIGQGRHDSSGCRRGAWSIRKKNNENPLTQNVVKRWLR